MLFPKIIGLICLFAVVSGQNLPADEVESLRIIARSLNKMNWDFNVNPCTGQSGWLEDPNNMYQNNVTCNCLFQNGTVCHIVSIILQGQNLTGIVPRELVRLPFLQQIDLTRNYLNGTIPPEWGSLSLVNISLVGNRITGPLPRELANISTLVSLALNFNQLSGTIPEEFGNFPCIERLLLTSNNLTGELPPSLANLTSLRDFRISDNNFSGSIPNFIQNWTNLGRLAIQASGLSGPIPSGIGLLTNLTDLRISDLSGNESSFPPLENIRTFRTLILRSCNIVGQLPAYIGQRTIHTTLDLSFNHLTGPIPESFSRLGDTDYVYLTGNNLDGPVLHWMLSNGQAIDLSYNNLTESSIPNCQLRRLNLFASSKGNTTGIVSCLRNTPCNGTFSSFHINCGGEQVREFEADTDFIGPSNFFQSNTNWGISSTGHFMDDNRPTDSYIRSNGSRVVGQNPELSILPTLYRTARLSPLSLTYYGMCLQNGNYTVVLHFAEIMFTDDSTYSSLGRRIFDIYIQGERVMRDFNIELEAGGVNMVIIRNFTAVVSDGTLDIRLYWAGKGTDGIPVRGVYGPLISAISVNHVPVPSENGNSISAGTIVGIVLGVLYAVMLFSVILWWKGCCKRKDTLEYELKGVDLQTTSFTLRKLKAATNDFDSKNKIGEGGFGPVFKGLLSDGTAIAVKQLSAKSKQGNREFVTEIGMISALQHPHLVMLYGCCIEGNQLFLIYEYMENNSLARALFGPKEKQINLDWTMRHKICIGIAKGLSYLHEESRLKIVHRDIKATNVLLDKNLFPKISDFGLAKLNEEDNTHISTRVAGTYGYMAPEYAMRGYLTDKADVYSFGVVLLEVVSGRTNTSCETEDDSFYLLDWANSLNETGNLMDLVDPRLESKFNKEEVLTSIKVALLCTNVVYAERPSMSSVVSMLDGRAGVQGFVFNSSVSVGKTKHEEMTSSLQATYSNGGEGQGLSMDVLWTDLYPVALNSEYWEKGD